MATATPLAQPNASQQQNETPVLAGHSRFTLELEFVQSLASPMYLNHLAANKYFDDSSFVNYLNYLQYWAEPKYAKYLTYPGPTLRALEMLQQEQFRKDILIPGVVEMLAAEWMEAGAKGPEGAAKEKEKEKEKGMNGTNGNAGGNRDEAMEVDGNGVEEKATDANGGESG